MATRTFSEIIELWPTTAALSHDLQVSPFTVAAWKRRGSIRPIHWPALLAAAKRRKIKLTNTDLIEAAALPKQEVSPNG